MAIANSEFLQLHSIDYKAPPEPKNRKIPVKLLMLWTYLTVVWGIALFFIINNEQNDWKKELVESMEELVDKYNATIDQKFLKQLDRFLFKRKGIFIVKYTTDQIAWMTITCTLTLSWIVVTVLLCHKCFNN
jgi:hypothetical protein